MSDTQPVMSCFDQLSGALSTQKLDLNTQNSGNPEQEKKDWGLVKKCCCCILKINAFTFIESIDNQSGIYVTSFLSSPCLSNSEHWSH